MLVNRPEQKVIRQALRRNQTSAETILWQYLRRKEVGIKFVRQHGIGNYIVDFCCRSKKLIIELDGNIHDNPEVAKNDLVREEFLKSLGYKVVRFKNFQVLDNPERVLEKIKNFL
jgi:very-short-patch-repair endonuclease